MTWQSMDTAPRDRDGDDILVAYDNGCRWEFYVVWWTPYDDKYPWKSEDNAFPDDLFDYWHPIPPLNIERS